MTRTLLLALHITAVAAWLGANFVQIVLSPRIARSPAATAAEWARQTVWLGRRYYNVVGTLIGLTGVLLVLDGDWAWSSGFIWVGVVVLVIGGLMGVLVFESLMTRRIVALDTGEAESAAGLLRRIMQFAVLDTVLVLIALVAMVHRWQAG